MMDKQLYHIEEVTLLGVNHPMLVVKGVIDSLKYTITVYADGNERTYKVMPNLRNKGFCIEVPLENKDKNVKVLLDINDEVCKIVDINNRKILRILNKLIKLLTPVFKRVKRALSKIGSFFGIIYRGIRFLWKEHHFMVPFSMWVKYLSDFKKKMNSYFHGNPSYNPYSQTDYLKWIETSGAHKQNIEIMMFEYNPLISILIPVYNIKANLLKECLDSILRQSYSNFEVCLVDDASSLEETHITLEEYLSKDERIRVHYRKENGHISKATNDALKMASGDFVALVDNDDILTEHALYENVKVLNEDISIDMIYSDEDKLDLKGKRRDPHFKPDFSPDTLLSTNYICHFAVLRRSIMNKIGGFRVGYEGAQDYDLFLRFSEVTNNIYHIPKILYHWRMVEGSTSMTIDNKDYAVERGRQALKDAIDRRGLNATPELHNGIPYFLMNYQYETEPSISIIIPTRDFADILETCLFSLYKYTEYKNFEVIVVDNNSEKAETFELFKKYENRFNNFKVVDAKFEFNYSKINNIAVKESKGDFIVLLNNDTEIISSNWLKTMVGYAMQSHIGAVGPKLLYPDNTVQHGGVVLGVGGIANHAFLDARREDPGLYARLAVPFNYAAVTAACLMIEKSKYLKVGGLEERLMVAFNDVDLNMKLLEAGYYNVFLPQVELYHHESKSRGLDTTGEKYKRFLSEHDLMIERWGNKLYTDKYYNPNFSLKKTFMLDEKVVESEVR